MSSALAVAAARRLGLPAGVRDAGLILAGSLLVAALAQISVPLPFTPVPVTGQTLGVLLVGAALGARRGAASLALYVAEGALGLPVFAPPGAPGPARLLGPTAGYLLGFIAGAWIVGRLAERGYGRHLGSAFTAMAAGQATIFTCGLIGLAPFVGAAGVLGAGFWPFVPGALIKSVLAALALHGAGRVLDDPTPEPR